MLKIDLEAKIARQEKELEAIQQASVKILVALEKLRDYAYRNIKAGVILEKKEVDRIANKPLKDWEKQFG